jgi:hypothetical protein
MGFEKSSAAAAQPFPVFSGRTSVKVPIKSKLRLGSHDLKKAVLPASTPILDSSKILTRRVSSFGASDGVAHRASYTAPALDTINLPPGLENRTMRESVAKNRESRVALMALPMAKRRF